VAERLSCHRHVDLYRDVPAPGGRWSVGSWIESLEQLEHPEQALTRLRGRREKLVMRVNTSEAVGTTPCLMTATGCLCARRA
jgi:hypothetical protein